MRELFVLFTDNQTCYKFHNKFIHMNNSGLFPCAGLVPLFSICDMMWNKKSLGRVLESKLKKLTSQGSSFVKGSGVEMS